MPSRVAVTATRAHAAVTGVAVPVVAATSGLTTTTVWAATGVYCAALAVVARWPRSHRAHQAAATAGVVWWLTRSSGFLALVLGGRGDLVGAVAERWWGATATLTVHVLCVNLTAGHTDISQRGDRGAKGV